MIGRSLVAVGLALAALGAVPAAESARQAFERRRVEVEPLLVRFESGETAVDDDESDVIVEHARLAQDFPADRLTVRSACGGEVAIGRQRADAVKRSLILLGVDAARIATACEDRDVKAGVTIGHAWP